MSDTSTGTGAGSGASGSPPAGDQASSGTATITTTPQDWTTGLNDDLKGYVQNKGFKAPQDVVESYRNFEKLQGVPQERLLKLPDKMEGDDGRAVFERLGMPKDKKDYNVQIPKELGDERLSEWIKDVAYKNNFTNRQAEGLVKDWTERMAATTKEAKDHADATLKQANDNLKKEWGAAFEQNKQIINEGAIRLGLSEDQLLALGSALGGDKAAILMHKLATATGESPFVGGNNPGGGTNTPSTAKSKINDLINDAGFNSRLSNGDKDAKDLWNRLHIEAANGEMVSL